MPVSKLAVSMAPELVARVDRLVKERRFRNRSHAIQVALREKLDRIEHTRLARECRKLDPAEERGLADEGLTEELAEWPEY
ncbi:MAG TPA: ribbon-helix-helix domain-containing protein [Phycisphaerae bacterium]|nr:ribbon-helix-helix domain-containing protein [Phycisphaerae bacterium]